MILRGDVQKALYALLEKEWCYWKDHRQEWMRLCLDPGDLWDGYHWYFVRCLVQMHLWEDLRNHIKGLRDTNIRDQILQLIQLNTPRLYHSLWGEHEENVKSRKNQKVRKGVLDLNENHV